MRFFAASTFLALVAAGCGSSSSSKSSESAASQQKTQNESGGTSNAAYNEEGTAEGARADSAKGDDNDTFALNDSDTAGDARGEAESKIRGDDTHAAMKFFVVNKEKEEPISGIVIVMEGPDGTKYYTEETDGVGYGEVLVPIGQKYEINYLSLGRKDVTANVEVPNEPRQNIKLTLRYKPRPPAPPKVAKGKPEREPAFRLDGVTFKTGSSTLKPESEARLEEVVEFMSHKKSARIEVSGHTDNAGNSRRNKTLSLRRAEAVKSFLVGKGIDGSRIEALGFGDERPIESNDTDEGRRKNRRIEARELPTDK